MQPAEKMATAVLCVKESGLLDNRRLVVLCANKKNGEVMVGLAVLALYRRAVYKILNCIDLLWRISLLSMRVTVMHLKR